MIFMKTSSYERIKMKKIIGFFKFMVDAIIEARMMRAEMISKHYRISSGE